MMRVVDSDRETGGDEALAVEVAEESPVLRPLRVSIEYCDADFVRATQLELAEAFNLTQEEMDRAAHEILQAERRRSMPQLHRPGHGTNDYAATTSPTEENAATHVELPVVATSPTENRSPQRADVAETSPTQLQSQGQPSANGKTGGFRDTPL
ncbi:hypothetical protein HPB51_011590 [Rhipicephalus microplus]|uniref:Uncharacterized protein n=1 Tax=Rhipicephalus microplus TaxID=6941 RepID=A0A9J6E8U8_RHIMP|nr:hypothetical protein HPB51_011590 [Rhipicephalus microplus]